MGVRTRQKHHKHAHIPPEPNANSRQHPTARAKLKIDNRWSKMTFQQLKLVPLSIALGVKAVRLRGSHRCVKIYFQPYIVYLQLRTGSRVLGRVCVGFRVYVNMFVVFLACSNSHYPSRQVQKLSGSGLVIGVSKCQFLDHLLSIFSFAWAVRQVCVGFRVYVSMFAVFKLECCNVHFLFVQVHRCPGSILSKYLIMLILDF